MKIDFDFLELLAKTTEALPENDALIILFKYLHERIPFDIAVCFSINRAEKLYTSFMEYSAKQIVPQYYNKKDTVLPISVLIENFGEDFSKTSIADDLSNNEDYARFFANSPYSGLSSISVPIYHDYEKNHFMCILFLSNYKNTFNEKHAQVIDLLKPLFQELILSLYLNNPGENVSLSPSGKIATTFEEQLSACPDLAEVTEAVHNVADFDTTVLIHGETGSGKEIVAEVIHSLSDRYDKPFVRVNCSAIPETLIESEFFGFEKGAFTGAIQSRKGYFEQAHKGTIYLDEVGELSLNSQVRLLRVLENREIRRIGSEKSINLDLRIIAATNKDLWEMVKRKLFREDLYYRLNVYPITVPPLRERRRDIFVLAQYYYNYYVQKFSPKTFAKLSPKNIYQLANFSWPGNVRQLRHAIERALVDSNNSKHNVLDFSFLIETTVKTHKTNVTELKEEIEKVLKLTNGRIQGEQGAAELLNINPATLRSRMRTLGIPFTKKDIQKQKEQSQN